MVGQDAGETPEAAALREAEEECGLQIAIRQQIGTADELVYDTPTVTYYRKRCTFFLAEVVGRGTPCEPDHLIVWLSQQAALAVLRHESQRWAVVEALRLHG